MVIALFAPKVNAVEGSVKVTVIVPAVTDAIVPCTLAKLLLAGGFPVPGVGAGMLIVT
jgi:hypothetical protein